MIPFGQTLKAAREAKGLSAAQIAESTHLMTSMVMDLENEDFSKIVAPIYGRGYVKLYCNTVGIDSKPMIDAFMELYSGKNDSGPTTQPAPQAAEAIKDEPKAEVAPEPAKITAAEPPSGNSFKLEGESIEKPETIAGSNQQVATPNVESRFSRYSSPLRDPSPSIGFNPSIWRWAIIGIFAILILWGVFSALRALHSATTDPVTEPAAPTIATVKKAPEESKAEKRTVGPQKRETVKVDPLYID